MSIELAVVLIVAGLTLLVLAEAVALLVLARRIDKLADELAFDELATRALDVKLAEATRRAGSTGRALHP